MKKVIEKVTSWLSGKVRRKKPSGDNEQKPQVPAKKDQGHRREGHGKHPRPARHRGEQPRVAHRRHEKPSGATPVQPAEAWDPSQYVVPPVEGKTRFHDLGLPDQILHAIADLHFQYCTPVQADVLPHALHGRDIVGQAQTGTGKSAAFLLTILTHLLRKPVAERRKASPRALILAPTRELVLQIEKDAKALAKYIPCTIVAVFGGMNYERQKRWLDTQVDIVVATPGRLIDFKAQRLIHLNHVEILVIDEADRMLDMGFIPDVRSIVHSTPHKDKRQTMFFTATLNDDVKRLAASWTKDAVQVEITPEQVAVESVEQRVYICTTDEKFKLLYNMIVSENLERVIVFGNRKDETLKLAENLMSRGISCGLLSGDVSQRERVRTLEAFREGKFRVLVATDVAARGLHIEGVSHVVNYNLPLDPEDYVHRIGRTGRAGASGISVSFADEEDGVQIPVIEEFIGKKLSPVYPPDAWLQEPPPPSVDAAKIQIQPKRQYEDKRRHVRGHRRGGHHRSKGAGGARA